MWYQEETCLAYPLLQLSTTLHRWLARTRLYTHHTRINSISFYLSFYFYFRPTVNTTTASLTILPPIALLLSFLSLLQPYPTNLCFCWHIYRTLVRRLSLSIDSIENQLLHSSLHSWTSFILHLIPFQLPSTFYHLSLLFLFLFSCHRRERRRKYIGI